MKIGKWTLEQKKESVVEEDNDILVRDEWYQYYRECSRKLRLILRIIDHAGIVRDDDTMNTVIGEAHRDMRKLADVLDPEEKKEWLSRSERVDKDIASKEPDKVKLDIGEYKRECINKLKYIKKGSSLLVEDRIYQTVDMWTREMKGSMKEFKDKIFHVEKIDKNTQRIWRVK